MMATLIGSSIEILPPRFACLLNQRKTSSKLEVKRQDEYSIERRQIAYRAHRGRGGRAQRCSGVDTSFLRVGGIDQELAQPGQSTALCARGVAARCDHSRGAARGYSAGGHWGCAKDAA